MASADSESSTVPKPSEVPMEPNTIPKPREVLAEFLGTFLLVLTVGCNVLSQNAIWAGVSIGCVLMVAIYSLGCVSGANFNPAVSFALATASSLGLDECDFSWKKFVFYAIFQTLGGVVASMCYTLVFMDTFNLQPTAGFGWINACLCEFLYTFMLCFVVLNVTASKAARDKHASGDWQFYGLAIGFVIVAGAYGAGSVSGGCFNPAVAFSIDIASISLGFGWCMLYIVSEFLGAAAAAAMFKLCRPVDFGQSPAEDASDENKSKDDIQPKLIAEFLGTYMLVLTVGLNVRGSSPAGAFSIAASLMCMIYALGDVSGAHFNPAVTVAIVAAGKMEDRKQAMWYIVAQLLGGALAACTYVLIWAGQGFELAGNGNWAQIAVAEVVFTFVLVFVVLCVAVADRKDTSNYFGLAIGSCVTVGGFAIGSISAGSLNPAVSFGIAVGASIGGQGATSLWNAFLYSVFEVAGGILATAAFTATHVAKAPEAPAKPKKPNKPKGSPDESGRDKGQLPP